MVESAVLDKEEVASARSVPARRVRLIINPGSGRGVQLPRIMKEVIGIQDSSLQRPVDADEAVTMVAGALGESGVDAEITRTTAPGEAREVARRCAAERFDMVIAAGGDGTVNEVANGLAHSDTALALIPLGTVNVVAHQLGIPASLREAAEVIARGRARAIDLGRVNGRYFVNLAGIGFDAYVMRRADSRLKSVLGAGAYLVVGAYSMVRYPFRRMAVFIDDQPIPRSGYLVLIGNGRFYGGNLVIAPEAKLDDGRLDVCILKRRELSSRLGYLVHLRRGDITGTADVEYYQCRRIRVTGKGRHYVHVDGEYFGRTPVDITVEPAALNVIY